MSPLLQLAGCWASGWRQRWLMNEMLTVQSCREAARTVNALTGAHRLHACRFCVTKLFAFRHVGVFFTIVVWMHESVFFNPPAGRIPIFKNEIFNYVEFDQPTLQWRKQERRDFKFLINLIKYRSCCFQVSFKTKSTSMNIKTWLYSFLLSYFWLQRSNLFRISIPKRIELHFTNDFS